MKNRNIILGVTFLLTACASQQAAKVATAPAQTDLLPTPAPTYYEKVESVPAEQVKTASCPTDQKWQSLEWKKIGQLANACVKSKEWDKVQKLGNWMAIHEPTVPWGSYYVGLAAAGNKDFPRALWMLDLALKKAPHEGLIHYEMARIYWDKGDEPTAIQHMKLASENNSSLTEAHFIIGHINMLNNEIPDAERYLERALRSNAKHVPSLLALASIKLNAKDYARSEGYLDQVLKLDPHNFKARLLIARIQEEHLKKLQEALHNYKQLRELSAEKKFEDVNLDEKIQALEQSLTQAAKVTERTPSAAEGSKERQVKQ